MNRRKFFGAVAIGLVATLAPDKRIIDDKVEIIIKSNEEKLKLNKHEFDKQWNFIIEEFIPEINRLQLNGEIDLNYILNEFDNLVFENKISKHVCTRKDFEKYGKVFIISESFIGPEYGSITAGNIIESYNNIYTHHEKNLSYKVITYESEVESFDDIKNKRPVSFWYTDTAYLNLKEAKRYAEIIKELRVGGDKRKYAERLKKILEDKSKINNTTFEKEFIEMIKATDINWHEPEHYWSRNEDYIYKKELENSPEEYKDWVRLCMPN